MSRRHWLRFSVLLFWLAGLGLAISALAANGETSRRPVLIGLTAEFGLPGGSSAQWIERGILLAIDEINAAGGVLNGRPLALVKRDDRGVPARGVDNFNDLTAQPDVMAVFGGRFSPVAVEIARAASRRGVPLLLPWSSADSLTTERPGEVNHVFRLSLTDSWAMEAMLDHAWQRGIRDVLLMVPSTAWGRSNEAAFLAWKKRHGGLRHETLWHNWGESDFGDRLTQARDGGAQAIIMVANETEGLAIVRTLAVLPESARLPVISHWGILGVDFVAAAQGSLAKLDLAVVFRPTLPGPRLQSASAGVKRLFDIEAADLNAHPGFAHAYDLTHLLARAIRKAGVADRSAIRTALENLDPYDGLVRRYTRPFTPSRHEALQRRDAAMARFAADGSLRPAEGRK